MARPSTGRRLHTAAFDEICAIRGKTCALLAKELLLSEGHLSDMRAGRRLATPPTAAALAEALNLTSPEAILWPATAADLKAVA